MKNLLILLAIIIPLIGNAQTPSMWNQLGIDTTWVSGDDDEYFNIRAIPSWGGRTYQLFTPLGGEPTAEFTYLLSPTGSDSNDGLTLSTPFKTLNKLATVMSAGDTALLRGGTYYFDVQQVWIQ